jgi:glycogen debranching enzyme GlgX
MRQAKLRSLDAGTAEPLGASITPDGVNFAVFSEHASRIELCLFDAKGRETARIALPERTGHVFHGHVGGLGQGQRYGLRAHGPHSPEKGLFFDPAKLLADPHALAIDRPFRPDPVFSVFGANSAAFAPKSVVEKPPIAADTRPRTPWSRTILYELHAKGFTKRMPGIPAALRGRFAALGEKAAIDHICNLGVTTIEVLPLAATMDERHLTPLGLTNYWGYNSICFSAPDPRLAPGGWSEIAGTVDKLHAAGIEVILDVVFNHSGEGDSSGPVLCLRGLDNLRYYRTRPDDPSRYADDAGTGNTLRCDDPQVVRLIMDSLRNWALYGGIDGFRFDLAATLGRRSSGFDPAAPLFAAMLQDPILRDRKLIAEAWDIGPGGYQVGRLDAPFADWNDRYRDTMRRFWRGDREVFGEAATRLAGSADLFAKRQRPSLGINFIVAHDGFTLSDLGSHERKDNSANGENNRDGTDANYSWNHGIEGDTTDPAILARRARDERNLLATLLMSIGTPMLLAGSEIGQSQGGNNNAYAQDNAISWLDWEKAQNDLAAFVRKAIALRASHPVFSADRFLSGRAADGSPFPDLVWLTPNGKPMAARDWEGGPHETLIALFAAADHGGHRRLLLALHRGGRDIDLALPHAQQGKSWLRTLDSADPKGKSRAETIMTRLKAGSVLVLSEE